MTIKGRVTGGAALRRNLRRVTNKVVPDAAAAGIYGLGVENIRKAAERIPVASGTARASAYSTLPVETSRGPVVESGFGGKADAYIVGLHERTEISHPTGRAKFLESAVNESRGSGLRTVAKLGGQAFDNERGARQVSGVAVDPRRGAG